MSDFYNKQDQSLRHFGVLGMKWGHRRARNTSKKAISLGKTKNLNELALMRDPKNKQLKTAYKQSKKDYKRALRENSRYQKKNIKSGVYKDASRKYLSESKKVKKLLDADPKNKKLKRQYSVLNATHEINKQLSKDALKAVSKLKNTK